MFKGKIVNWTCEDWNAVYRLLMVAEKIILSVILKVGAFINYLSLLPWFMVYTYQVLCVRAYNDSTIGDTFNKYTWYLWYNNNKRGDTPSMLTPIFAFNNTFIQILIFWIFKYTNNIILIFKFLRFYVLLKKWKIYTFKFITTFFHTL